MLLNGIARLTQHAGQARLLLTLNHQSNNKIKAMNANIRAGLDTILSNTPQLPKAERWPALVRYIISKIVATRPQKTQFLDSPTFCLTSDSG
jgi:hypothetical protein